MDAVKPSRRRLTPEEAFLRRLGPIVPDDGKPDGSDGQDEEDYSPPVYGWRRDK
jgi:hypothetical protein